MSFDFVGRGEIGLWQISGTHSDYVRHTEIKNLSWKHWFYKMVNAVGSFLGCKLSSTNSDDVGHENQ